LPLVRIVSQPHRARDSGVRRQIPELEAVTIVVMASVGHHRSGIFRGRPGGRYASRWGIEQAFADARQIMGVGEARSRIRRAVERTVPFGLICFSVVTVWYALH